MKTNAILHQVHVHIITEAANKKLRVKHGFGQHVTPQTQKALNKRSNRADAPSKNAPKYQKAGKV